jgi:hypothetical protein
MCKILGQNWVTVECQGFDGVGCKWDPSFLVTICYHTSLDVTKFKILNPHVNTKGVEIVSPNFERTSHVRFMSLKQCSKAF